MSVTQQPEPRATVLCERAKASLNAHRWDEAADVFQQAVDADPAFFWAHYGLGEALSRLERWEDAVRTLQHAITLRADVAWAHYHLGYALAKLDRPDEAKAAYERAVALDADIAWPHLQLGDLLSTLERWQEAAAAYQRAIEINPGIAAWHVALGSAQLRLQRWELAAAAFAQAVALAPQNCWTYSNLGEALFQLGRREEATGAFQKAVQLGHIGSLDDALAAPRRVDRPVEPHVPHVALGDRLRALHCDEEAASAYRRAVDLARVPGTCLELGAVLESCGQVAHAVSAYARAIVLDPSCTAAYRNLTDLLERSGEPDTAAIVNAQAPPGRDRVERRLRIVRADNHLVFSKDGRSYVDLFCGSGSVFLGHVNPDIAKAVHEQVDKVWITGAAPTETRLEAEALVNGVCPSTHRLAGLYSTGMEAAEFALRVARAVTRRRGIVGFERCMHGKSTATAYLAWPNDHVRLPDVCRVPYVPQHSEEWILERLAALLATEHMAAVFIEPLQASGGGHLASPAFFQELGRLCVSHGTLLVIDEILTGFFRTGDLFLSETLGVTPAILLVGKAMANGFPVSGVVVDRTHEITSAMLPGSTFAGNALASAAVAATVRQMQHLPMTSTVERIGQVIMTTLDPVRETAVAVRGRGALWVLELPANVNAFEVAERIVEGGVIVSVVGPYLRLLPPATIPLEQLVQACTVVRDACLAFSGAHADA